ncbi:hypothetical protein TSUD_177860 [Trifolium subterraneum]|uniref:TF-B3 domain-containing protein n=1 Tax=Trifolium subterraneum TaxID=3900 RepID=A0A2Z6MLX3_TRISU|nr:hypothetical protein TSUD_177860 [Trifolium subterraneum]
MEKQNVGKRFDAVADILPGKESLCIMVRVLRLWTIPTFLCPSETSSIEMVLLDEEHFPHCISRFAILRGQKQIELECENSFKGYQCKIVTSKRCRYEKYLTRGWYEFLKDSKLCAGDLLKFVYPTPSSFFIVEIIRRRERI